MKKLLILTFIILINCFSSFAQDTPVRVVNSYGDIARNRAWSDMNRVFLVTPANPDQSECIYFHNQNTTSAHSFTFTVFQTGDIQVVDFTNNQDRWSSVSVVGTSSPVPALTTTSVFVHANAAAKIAFSFSGSTLQAGSPDLADIWIVQTTANTCGPSLLTQGISDPCNSLSFSNRHTTAISITTSTTVQLAAPVNGQVVYPCSLILDLNVNSSATITAQLQYGTGATCGTGTVNLTGAMPSGASTGLGPVPLAVAGSTLFAIPASQGFCIVTVIGGAPTAPNNGAFGYLTYIQQ